MMILKRIVSILTIFIVLSCSKEDKIIDINTPEQLISFIKNNEGEIIEKRGKSLLTFHEIVNKTYNYKKIKTYDFSDNFVSYLILSQPKDNQSYVLLFRTVSKEDDKILDTFLLSSYNKKSKAFCGGYITNKYIMQRDCSNVDFKIKKQIAPTGKFYNIN